MPPTPWKTSSQSFLGVCFPKLCYVFGARLGPFGKTFEAWRYYVGSLGSHFGSGGGSRRVGGASRRFGGVLVGGGSQSSPNFDQQMHSEHSVTPTWGNFHGPGSTNVFGNDFIQFAECWDLKNIDFARELCQFSGKYLFQKNGIWGHFRTTFWRYFETNWWLCQHFGCWLEVCRGSGNSAVFKGGE